MPSRIFASFSGMDSFQDAVMKPLIRAGSIRFLQYASIASADSSVCQLPVHGKMS